MLTNFCIRCGLEFTDLNPCALSDGSAMEGQLHVNGVCTICDIQQHTYQRPYAAEVTVVDPLAAWKAN